MSHACASLAIDGKRPDPGANSGRVVDIGATAAVLALPKQSSPRGPVLYVAEGVFGNQWEVLT